MPGEWGFDVGPFHAGSDGVGVRPQLKVGYNDENVRFVAGLDDVRDGLSGGLAAQARRRYRAGGDSVKEVLKKMRAESEIRVLDDIIKAAPQLVAEIMRMTGVDIPAGTRIVAMTTLKIGAGVCGGICLGWADTKGFHMVGVHGHASAAASLGGDIIAGLHHSRKLVKAVLGVSNICVELVFALPEPAQGGTAGVEGEAVQPEEVPGTMAAAAAAKGTSLKAMQERGEIEAPPPAADPEGEIAVEDTVPAEAGTL